MYKAYFTLLFKEHKESHNILSQKVISDLYHINNQKKDSVGLCILFLLYAYYVHN